MNCHVSHGPTLDTQQLKTSLLQIVLLLALLPLHQNALGSESFGFGFPDIDLPENIARLDQHRNGNRIIRGAASKGPIAGATVSIYEIDDFGIPVGSPIASTTTNENGEFTVSLASTSDMLMAITSGGTFIDESDQRPLAERRRITLSSSDSFRSIINSNQSTVAITPFTDTLVERATTAGRLGGFKDIMEQIGSAATTGFGFSLFSTLPVDPITPAASATNAQLQYALLLGTVANIANTAAIKLGAPAPNYEIIKAVILDMSDGSSDGLLDGNPIPVSIGGSSKIFPSIDFDQQLTRFRNNNYNAYAGIALPEYDDGEADLSLGFPPLMFTTFEGVPGSFGITQFSFARIDLNTDGTGFLLDEQGGQAFVWAGLGDTLQIDFSSVGGKLEREDTFFRFNESGIQEEILLAVFTDFIEINLQGTADGKKQNSNMTRIGRVEERNLATGATEVNDENREDVLTVYDAARLEPVPSPDTWEEFPALPARTGEGPDRAMGVDQMQPNADGTGVAKYKNVAFNWTLPADGSVRLDFDDGEYGNYYLLSNEDDGDRFDYVAVDYFDGNKLLHTGSVVFSNFEDLDWNSRQAAGSYVTTSAGTTNSGEVTLEKFIYHTYPDQTGVGEFEFVDPESGLLAFGVSAFKICWNVNAQGELQRFRTFIPFEELTRGALPTVAQCASLQADDISWVRVHELYDITGSNEFKTVVRQGDNDCGVFPTPGCSNLTRTITFPALYSEVVPLQNVPPIPVDDSGNVTVGSSVTINVLQNDITSDLLIDPGSLTVENEPAELVNGFLLSRVADGSASIVNGAIEYTPNPGNTNSRTVNFAYRISDSAGNRSIAGNVFIDVIGSP